MEMGTTLSPSYDVVTARNASLYPLPTGLVKNPKAHSLTYCLLPIVNKVLGYSTLFDRVDLQPHATKHRDREQSKSLRQGRLE